ncbi:AAA family ATPase [Desulfovibrio sp. UCD-KL4C]|uniref:AAA family ATPase n=1 Tax=Desulfovibrio sp. UCD-KL4C TaxID=2578120 RepID=UPI0025C1F1A3|nr:ATP-binding protein [Desulfovibrio sp. UCD-KL4C]
MATAEQIKSLIRSHVDEDRDRFLTIALQVAAHEARKGHSAIANDIKGLVDKAKSSSPKVIPFNRDFNDLVLGSTPHTRLADIILENSKTERIKRVILEYHKQDQLKKHGLANRRKILLAGPPGTGKTMTSSVLAGELKLPLYTILMDKLVTKFMGETSAKLRQIFDIISSQRGVYLFDEFDAIGAERGRENDVGEMRRVLNSFLQLIEHDSSDSLIVAATNNANVLDQALFRRFDDVLYYSLPTKDEAYHLINNRLANFKPTRMGKGPITDAAKEISHAEIVQACDDSIKDAILSDKNKVSIKVLKNMLRDRRSAYGNSKF